MKITKNSISKLLLFLLVVLPIYQDSPLSRYLGAAGYSLLMPFVLIVLFLVLLFNKISLKKRSRVYELLLLGVWLFIISYIAIIIWGITGHSMTVLSEFLPFKAFKVWLQFISYPAYIILIVLAVKRTGVEYIAKYSFFALVLLTVICAVELQQSPYALKSIHFAATFPYWRVRLLTLESSMTAMMIYVYLAISVINAINMGKRGKLVISILCALFLIANTGSKALILAIMITAIIYLFFSFKHLKKTIIIVLILISIFFVILSQTLLPQLIDSIENDISQYTSLATRLYTGIIGLYIGIIYPFGVGGAVYLGVFQNALKMHLATFSRLLPTLRTSEIDSLISNVTDEALTVKSGLQFNMYWGILGTIFLARNFKKIATDPRLLKVENHELIKSCFWTAVILVTFATSFSFEFWLLYAFLLCLIENRKDNANECENRYNNS